MITFIRNYSLNYSLLWLTQQSRVIRAQIMCRDEVMGGFLFLHIVSKRWTSSAIRMQLVSGLQIFKPLKLEQQEMTAVS